MSRELLKHLSYTFMVVIGMLISSCSNHKLQKVERVMETSPEQADSLLNEIPVPAGGRSKALYALLKTQIDYKLYRDADNDSIIRTAVDYYGRKYKGYHSAMAWYSLGCIAAGFGQDSTAADAYFTAMSLFPDTLVRYYALSEQNLSHIYLEHKMDEEALTLIESCRINAVRLGDSAAIAFCDYNIAKSHLYNNRYDKAQTMFMDLKGSKWLSSNTNNAVLLQLAKICCTDTHDYEAAIQYVDDYLLRNNHRNPNGAAYTIKADAYLNLNQIDSARHYYNMSLTDSDNPYTICNSYRRLAEVHSILGNNDSASYYTRRVSDWADVIVSESGSEVILKALLNNSQTGAITRNRNHIFLIVLIIVGLSAAIVLFLTFTARKHSSTNSKQTPDIHRYSRAIEDFKSSELYKLMIIASHSNKELEAKSRQYFEESFHDSLLELRQMIVSSSNHLTCMELDYCMVILLGFKQRDFHLFFSISYSGSRKIKTRIKDKMPDHLFRDIFGTVQ